MSENEEKPSSAPEQATNTNTPDNDVQYPKQQYLCCDAVCAEKFSYDADQIFWYPEGKKWLCAECLKELNATTDGRLTLEQYFQKQFERQERQYSEPAYRERSSKRTRGTLVSDRDDLMTLAVRMFESFQHRKAVAHQQVGMEQVVELEGEESQAYAAAMKYLTDEFKKGTTPTKQFLFSREDHFSEPV